MSLHNVRSLYIENTGHCCCELWLEEVGVGQLAERQRKLVGGWPVLDYSQVVQLVVLRQQRVVVWVSFLALWTPVHIHVSQFQWMQSVGCS